MRNIIPTYILRLDVNVDKFNRIIQGSNVALII